MAYVTWCDVSSGDPIYLWQGPGDPDGAPAEITAASQVRVRGALALDTDGRPLIVSATIDAIN